MWSREQYVKQGTEQNVEQGAISLQNHAPHVLMQLPLLLRWYHRVQDVPGVRRAAENCGIALFRPQVPQPCSTQAYTPHCLESEQESPAPPQERFVGGPRPTLTKLQRFYFAALVNPSNFKGFMPSSGLQTRYNSASAARAYTALCTLHLKEEACAS
ncbi:glutathione S-transferase C-terminal domain-containing protein isoform X1 [Tachysurus ichikawai]